MLLARSLWKFAISMSVLGWAPWSALYAADFEVVILKDGQRVTGEVVADKPNALYVDLGYDILRIPRDQVLRRAKIDESSAGSKGPARATDLDTSGFYTAGLLKPSSVKELVGKFGEAVLSQQDVGGLDVAVHYILAMGISKAARRLQRRVHGMG